MQFVGCFNGAAPLKARKLGCPNGMPDFSSLLQWGRAVEGAETPTVPHPVDIRHATSFNGAAPLKARKLWPLRRAGWSPSARFNGAAPLKARKHRVYVDGRARKSGGFNGAAPLKARKRSARKTLQAASYRLQWGRAVEGAETAGS